MRPEWLTTKPSFRAAEWLVMARPDGERCVVTASRGITVSRDKNGNMRHRPWPSELPSGSRKTHHGRNDEYTLLDCVFDRAMRTYYVVDIM
jgi:snurportin-1